jgi:hypothetical protein
MNCKACSAEFLPYRKFCVECGAPVIGAPPLLFLYGVRWQQPCRCQVLWGMWQGVGTDNYDGRKI